MNPECRRRIAESLLMLTCVLAAAGCENPVGIERVPPISAQWTPGEPLGTDAFDRADENPMGGDWTSGAGDFGDLQLVGGGVRSVSEWVDAAAYYNAVAWPDDQWSEVQLTSLGSEQGGPAVRLSASAVTGYVFAVHDGGSTYFIAKGIDGWTPILAIGSYAFAVGDVLRLEARGDTLRAYVNGVLVDEVLDDDIPSGHAGIWIYNHNADGLTLDNWAGGGFVSGPPPELPAAPTGLEAAAVSASRIDLSWTDNAANEDGYRIERCAGAGCSTFTEIATVGANVVSYQNTGLAASTSYSYRVRAYNADGTSAYSNTATAATQAQPAADRLPDLGMARLSDLRIRTSNGRRLLRYSMTIVNVGSGDFELHGRRSSTSEDHMSVAQRIFDDADGWRDVPTTAEMEFGGDGHDHWHVHDLALSELYRLDDGVYLTRSDKVGFCFWDNVEYRLSLPGAPPSPVYGESGCGGPSSLTTRMGLSIGWGDIYHYSLPDQFIDITGLPDGRYRMVVTADASGWFAEENENNNFTSVDLELYDGGTRLRILGYGPSAVIAASYLRP